MISGRASSPKQPTTLSLVPRQPSSTYLSVCLSCLFVFVHLFKHLYRNSHACLCLCYDHSHPITVVALISILPSWRLLPLDCLSLSLSLPRPSLLQHCPFIRSIVLDQYLLLTKQLLPPTTIVSQLCPICSKYCSALPYFHFKSWAVPSRRAESGSNHRLQKATCQQHQHFSISLQNYTSRQYNHLLNKHQRK